MHFNNYVYHRETQPFDEIVIYSGWLAFGSCFIASHRPECVMRKFSYTQTISRHPDVSVIPAFTRIHIDDMFNDYEGHLVSEEAHATIIERDWSYVEGYIRWFFRMSHLYMVQAASEDPHRPVHQEILVDEQTQLDHVEDVFPRCRRIVEIVQAGIDKGIFPDGYAMRQILYVIMVKTNEALMYRRQRQRIDEIDGRGGRVGRGGRREVIRHTQ
ncbi:unnamed protein product [Lathyrus oleraceus]